MALFCGFLLTSGCIPAHKIGLMKTVNGQPQLVTMDGDKTKLKLQNESEALRILDGPSVEVWGKTNLSGHLVVNRFRVHEGNHGLAVWIGQLRRLGVQLGIDDANSGAFYLMGEGSWRHLEPFVGDRLLIEGFVDGPHRVKVLHFQVLDGPSAGQTGSLTL